MEGGAVEGLAGLGEGSDEYEEEVCRGGGAVEGSFFGLKEKDCFTLSSSWALSTPEEDDREGAKSVAMRGGVTEGTLTISERSTSPAHPSRAFSTAFFWSDARPLAIPPTASPTYMKCENLEGETANAPHSTCVDRSGNAEI